MNSGCGRLHMQCVHKFLQFQTTPSTNSCMRNKRSKLIQDFGTLLGAINNVDTNGTHKSP